MTAAAMHTRTADSGRFLMALSVPLRPASHQRAAQRTPRAHAAAAALRVLIRMLRNKLAPDTTFSAELHDTSRYQKNIYISNLGGRCERADFCDTSDTSRYEKAYTYQTWVGGVNWSSFPIQLIRTDTKKHIHIKLGLEV